MRDFSFGQYYPENSFVHKMDARAKILITIAYIVAVFIVNNFGFYGLFACLFFLLVCSFFSKISIFKLLSSIKGILFFIILSAVLQIFLNKEGTPLWEGGFITDVGVYSACFISLRIVLVVMGASILTFTTSPVEIADGIESLLTPLKFIKFPVHEFALTMSIALRFIPTLFNETDRIIKAQKSRGANFEKGGLISRIKALVPIIIPLLISSFRRADELADAMDSRCYSASKKRTKYKKMTITFRDVLGVLFIAGLITAIVFLNKYILF